MAYLFLTPSFLGVTVFFVLPFLDVVRRSFSDAMGRFFVGLENYESVWNNQAFRLAGGNTICFLAAALPLLFTGSLVLSLMVYETKNCKGLFKTSLILPMAVPAAAMVLVWKLLLCPDGAVNQLLMALTGQIWDRDWVNGRTAFPMLVATYLWKNTGYDMLLWLAGLGAIPDSLYDAAKMDGAGFFDRLRYITLPNLKNTMALVLILSGVNVFRVYREAYLLTGTYPDPSIYMIPHLFGHWFLTLDIQKMSTGAMFLVMFLAAVWGVAFVGRGKGRRTE
ncbi:MAG: sugar ABC transporter permease [Lachnospiraceae bacterium]|nr:sugar ABC transporter permease [Lachnospiraceae bacterium]